MADLQRQLAERDSKLKAARTDALESKMALAAKDTELVEAYQQLSLSVQQRSALRSELAQSQTELAETRAELEQLADEILNIRELMDSFGEELEGEGGDGWQEESLAVGGLALTSDGGGVAVDEGMLDVLHSLALLSRGLAEDAAEDDRLTSRVAQLERALAAEQQA